MNSKQQYLQAIGIQRWVMKEFSGSLPSSNIIEKTTKTDTAVKQIDLSDWTTLKQQVAACTLCDLHMSRKQTVFGVGNTLADWMIIGEAPGADEDAQGEPFVGRAGQLLNKMLEAIGLARERVFIANILKCRPPNNRDPQPTEVGSCANYLTQQIRLVSPKIILAVGRIAAQNLLKTDMTIGRLRGSVHNLSEYNVPVVVTYHPAYLLRKPTEKRKAWEDLKLACKAIQHKMDTQ